MRKYYSIIIITLILSVAMFSTKAIAATDSSIGTSKKACLFNDKPNDSSHIKLNITGADKESGKSLTMIAGYKNMISSKPSDNTTNLPVAWMIDTEKLDEAKQNTKAFSQERFKSGSSVVFKPEFSGNGLRVMKFSLNGISVDLSLYKTSLSEDDKKKITPVQMPSNWNMDSVLSFITSNVHGEARAVVNLFTW